MDRFDFKKVQKLAVRKFNAEGSLVPGGNVTRPFESLVVSIKT